MRAFYKFSMYTPFSVLGSDVIYSEGAVVDLLDTLLQLCGTQTTIFLAGELRNGKTFLSLIYLFLSFSTSPWVHNASAFADSILEYFLEAAMKDFVIGRVDQSQWHPDYCSRRVVMYILVKK